MAAERTGSQGQSHRHPLSTLWSKRWVQLALVLAILALATALRVPSLNDRGFGVDDAKEVLMAREIEPTQPHEWLRHYEMIHLLILRGSFALGGGESELAARLPTFVFALASIALSMWLAYRLFGRTAAQLSGLFLAVSHWHIQWSIISRPYMLFMLLGVIVCVLLEQLTETLSHHSRRWWPLLTALGGVLFLSLGVSRFALVLLVVVLFVALITPLRSRRSFWSVIVAPSVFAGILIVYLFVSGSFLHIYSEISGQWWSITATSFYYQVLVTGLGPAAFVLLILGGLATIAPRLVHARLPPRPQSVLASARATDGARDENGTNARLIPVVYGGLFFLVMGSLFFSKFDRYITMVIPIAFVLAALGVLVLVGYLPDRHHRHHCHPRHPRHPRGGSWGRSRGRWLLGIGCTVAVVLPSIVVGFQVAAGTASYRGNYEGEWREALRAVSPQINSSDPIITSQPTMIEYYLDRESWDIDTAQAWRQWIKPYLQDPSRRGNRTVWLVIDTGHYYNTLTRAQRECVDGSMILIWESEHNLVFRTTNTSCAL